MKSKLGYRPNGIVLLKNPSKHFQESDFLKAIDEWSVSMKDNPLPHFAAKIEVKQVNVFPYYGIASKRKYEDRSSRTVREYANPKKLPRMPGVPWNSVNLWNYNLKEQEKNFSVVLDDTVYGQGCMPCSETGSIERNCTSCGGRGSTMEMDYSNNVRRPVNCSSCGGLGTKVHQCDTCKGHGGFVNYIVCDVEYTYPSMKRFYCDDQVKDILNKLPFEDASFDIFSEVSTAVELVNFVEGTIKDDVTADIVSFVNSHDKEHQHFLHERTQYGQSFISLVRFEYDDNGREYTVAIYGDKDFIYAPESPISQSAERILDEANEYLVAHDFKAALPVLQMISNMGERRELLNGIVNRFQTNLSLAHAHLATEVKSEIQKSDNKYHSKFLGNKNIKDGEVYPLLTELLTVFALPFAIAVGLSIAKAGKIDVPLLTDFSVSCLFLTTVSFSTFFVFSRKKDIGFKKIWKYLLLSLAVGYIGFDTTHMLRHDSMWLVAPINAIVTLIASWIIGLFSDHTMKKIESQGADKFNTLLTLYKEKLPALEKFFPREEFSYIDNERKKDYQLASRELDDTLIESSEDPEMNLINEEEEEESQAA